MRTAFFQTMVQIAEKDPRIVFLTSDLGFRAVEPFAEAFPGRFINVGVSEQNMIGIATGMAEAGYIPFTYSIVPFAVLRPYEFIRNGPYAHQLPVRIVGMGGGVDYSTNGLTHYGLEDIAVLRAQPGFFIMAPADSQQTRSILNATWDLPGPVYYRVGKNDNDAVPGLDGRFDLHKLQVIREGKDILLLAVGNMLGETVAAGDLLAQQGVEATVAGLACVNPPPWEHLHFLLEQFGSVLTVEAHYITGGLGSLVAECIAVNALPCRLVRHGFSEMPDGTIGSLDYFYRRHQLTASQIAQSAKQTLESKRK
jgi:transketolase